MLEYSEKFSLLPSMLTASDLEPLRQSDFSDRQILSVILCAGYRNFITRVADGLGVELRQTEQIAPEILQAYGVTEQARWTTLYADRLESQIETRTIESTLKTIPDTLTHESASWLGAMPAEADHAEFSNLMVRVHKLTGPYPLNNLSLGLAARPDALGTLLDLGALVGLGGSGLGRRIEAIIGLTVASTMWCPYLGLHHAISLVTNGGSSDEVLQVIDDPSGAAFNGHEQAVARFCEKLTRDLASMAKSDVESLRANGFDDASIMTIATAAAWENFTGRIALALGTRCEAGSLYPEFNAGFGLPAA